MFTTNQVFEEESPAGQTPLCHHIGEVIECIKAQERELRSTGRKACVVIATDGESTDGNLADAMRPLQALPVWVVSVMMYHIRLALLTLGFSPRLSATKLRV